MQDSSQAKSWLYEKKKNRTMLFKNPHTGAWAGWFSKIIYAIAALIGGCKDDSDFKRYRKPDRFCI